MGIIKKIVLFITFVIMGGAALAAFTAERIYAGDYDVSTGNVVIDCSTDPNPVISGSSSSNHISITTASGHPAIVKLSGVNIDLSSGAAAAVTGNGNVVIELVGTNILKSGNWYAGIEKSSSSFLEIRGTGSLTATGGTNGAGIGGGQGRAGSNITINGGEVTANGGSFAAGIGGGGGQGGTGSNITINGGTVTANGGPIGSGNPGGAGIGGGADGEGSKITITGGTVIANGGGTDFGGAGIGGGYGGEGSDIMITGGTVTATGGVSGAGIGGGYGGEGSYIEITEGEVTATGGVSGAGIGGGNKGAGSEIQITGGTVTATGGVSGAGIGGGEKGAGSKIKITGGSVTAAGGVCGAGIGGGFSGTCSDITISNDAEVMAAGGINGSYGEGSKYGEGAAIGNGGDGGVNPINGEEVEPDISGLYTTGWIKKYQPGSTADDMIHERAAMEGSVIRGTVIPPRTVTFDPNGGTCDTKTAKTVSSNTGSQVLASLPVATRDGYTFDEWYTAKEGGDKITTDYDFKSNTTVYAHWTLIPPDPETYTITFDANGGTVSPTSGTTGTDGKLASLPTPEWEGHTFTGWFTEKDGVTEVTTSTVFSSNETIYAHWKKDEPTPGPEPNPDPTPSPAPNPAMDNLPSEITSVTKGDYRITFAGKIPFPGKSKVTVKNFGEAFSVSQGDASYTVTKIKINKKKKLIQVTGLDNADKKIVKEVKKATKGADGLSFDYTPYYVKDTDKVEPKFRKDELKSVKILINGKLYKAKNTEYEYDKEKKVITFKAPNLGGSYKVP